MGEKNATDLLCDHLQEEIGDLQVDDAIAQNRRDIVWGLIGGVVAFVLVIFVLYFIAGGPSG